MDLQKIDILGMTVTIPAFYRKLNSMPDDPPKSVSYGGHTEHTDCFIRIFPIRKADSFPKSKEEIILMTRHNMENDQGIIQIEAYEDYAYSIIKSMKEPHGVLYTLTFQKFYSDLTLNIQAFFEESGTTGIRDAAVFETCLRKKLVALENEGRMKGWTRDPYDASITQGALMNLSEREQFDAAFPDFPLSMCRKLVKSMIGELPQ